MAATRTVLVAAEDDDLRLLCRAILEHDGYRVLEARHGQELAAQLSGSLPDLLLLCSVNLPDTDPAGSDGSEPVGRLPVVLLDGEVATDEVASAWPGEVAAGWPGEVVERLARPLSPLTLVRVVHDVLDAEPVRTARHRQVADELTRRH